MSKDTRKPPQKPMRKSPSRLAWLLLAGALVVGTAALLAWRGALPASTTTGGAPSLKADKEKVDLGDVRLGQTVSVAFELTNTGAAPLRFREAPYVEVVEGC
jgi:hypothetical protein